MRLLIVQTTRERISIFGKTLRQRSVSSWATVRTRTLSSSHAMFYTVDANPRIRAEHGRRLGLLLREKKIRMSLVPEGVASALPLARLPEWFREMTLEGLDAIFASPSKLEQKAEAPASTEQKSRKFSAEDWTFSAESVVFPVTKEGTEEETEEGTEEETEEGTEEETEEETEVEEETGDGSVDSTEDGSTAPEGASTEETPLDADLKVFEINWLEIEQKGDEMPIGSLRELGQMFTPHVTARAKKDLVEALVAAALEVGAYQK